MLRIAGQAMHVKDRLLHSANACLAWLRAGLFHGLSFGKPRTHRAAAEVQTPVRMLSPTEQLDQLAGLCKVNQRRFSVLCEAHVGAKHKLDVVQYELQALVAELAGANFLLDTPLQGFAASAYDQI